jgi:Eco29kI restriction endonuclease
MTQAARSDGRGSYHDDFRLSITKALGDQLASALSRLGRTPLAEASLALLDERPGVYQLYVDKVVDGQWKEVFVYVGKADKSLPGRLRNHLHKLSGRQNINLRDVKFSCLYVEEDFSALAPEQLLISHHKELGGVPWNNNGFGIRDPGRQRDNTVLKRTHFDMLYPIDLDRPVEGLTAGETTLHELLKAVKPGLPYVFRYAEPPRSKQITVRVPTGAVTANAAFRLLSARECRIRGRSRPSKGM